MWSTKKYLSLRNRISPACTCQKLTTIRFVCSFQEKQHILATWRMQHLAHFSKNNWSRLWLTDLLWYILTTLKLVHEGFTYTHSEKDYIGNSKQLSLKWFYCVCPHLPVGVKDTFHNFFTIHIFTLSPKPPEKTLDVVSVVTVQV